MSLDERGLRMASALLGEEEAARLSKNATRLEQLEQRWRGRMKRAMLDLDDQVAAAFLGGEEFRRKLDFSEIDDIVMEHSLEVIRFAIATASPVVSATRFAEKKRLPRSLAKLIDLWDRWRKRNEIPPRQAAKAARIKSAYLAKVQSVWQQYSEDFREGKVFDQRSARKLLEDTTKMPRARAGTIINTETTYYYSKTRLDFYDESADVTHYLALAIRDHATTKWCKPYQMRGRGGLIYTKAEARREHSPFHWNCRTEMTPLTPGINPVHAKLVADKARWRSNNIPVALPPGWTSR